MPIAGSIDYMFSQLSLTGNVWATTLAGFILVLIIVFGAVMVFGKSKQELGAFGILIFVFLGMLLATVVGLFKPYVMLAFIIISLVVLLLKSVIGGGSSGK